jgi:hypothetical protein
MLKFSNHQMNSNNYKIITKIRFCPNNQEQKCFQRWFSLHTDRFLLLDKQTCHSQVSSISKVRNPRTLFYSTTLFYPTLLYYMHAIFVNLSFSTVPISSPFTVMLHLKSENYRVSHDETLTLGACCWSLPWSINWSWWCEKFAKQVSGSESARFVSAGAHERAGGPEKILNTRCIAPLHFGCCSSHKGQL